MGLGDDGLVTWKAYTLASYKPTGLPRLTYKTYLRHPARLDLGGTEE